MDIDELRTRVSAELPRIRQDLEDLVRIESVSADPARAAEVQRSAEAVAELFRAERFEDVQVVSTRDDGGAPAVLARKPAPAGQADGAALRAPRRAAGERPRRVGLPALRADRARRSALRPGCRRRQGRHRGAPRCDPRPGRRPRRGRHDVHRGRGGGRLRHPARPARPARRLPQVGRDRDRRQRQLGHRRTRPDDEPARAGPGRHRGAHPDPRRPLRDVGRDRARRADGAHPAARHAARRRGQRRGRRPARRSRGRRRLPRSNASGRSRASPRASS